MRSFFAWLLSVTASIVGTLLVVHLFALQLVTDKLHEYRHDWQTEQTLITERYDRLMSQTLERLHTHMDETDNHINRINKSLRHTALAAGDLKITTTVKHAELDEKLLVQLNKIAALEKECAELKKRMCKCCVK